MESLNSRGVTMAFDNAGLAAGTTTTLTSANAVDYAIDGKIYAKATASNEATPTTDANGDAFTAITASKGSVFVVCRNSGGNLKVMQGSVEDLTPEADGANTSFLEAPKFPDIPSDLCPYGYIITKVGASGSTWTFGASNLAGPPSNVKHLFVNCASLPTRPQTS